MQAFSWTDRKKVISRRANFTLLVKTETDVYVTKHLNMWHRVTNVVYKKENRTRYQGQQELKIATSYLMNFKIETFIELMTFTRDCSFKHKMIQNDCSYDRELTNKNTIVI